VKYPLPIRQVPALGSDDSERAALGALEVNVIFTDRRTTRAALQAAIKLATDLGARLRVRQVIAVPFSLPLDHPQISVPFAEDALANLALKFSGNSIDITAHLYLSRNQVDTLAQILQPNSLVVVAGRRLPWPTLESRIAKRLQAEGHRVVFVPMGRAEWDGREQIADSLER